MDAGTASSRRATSGGTSALSSSHRARRKRVHSSRVAAGSTTPAWPAAPLTRSDVDTVHFVERSAVVERALLSGTIGHYRRRPAVLVRVPVGDTGTAVLHGDHAAQDSGGDGELIAIAATIRLALGS